MIFNRFKIEIKLLGCVSSKITRICTHVTQKSLLDKFMVNDVK